MHDCTFKTKSIEPKYILVNINKLNLVEAKYILIKMQLKEKLIFSDAP